MPSLTACPTCIVAGAIHHHRGRCFPQLHSPDAVERGSQPLHPGKTARDHASGAWGRRFANRAHDSGRRPHGHKAKP